jgi:hypothetical protein
VLAGRPDDAEAGGHANESSPGSRARQRKLLNPPARSRPPAPARAAPHACGCRISRRRRPFVVGLSKDRRATKVDSACGRAVAVAPAAPIGDFSNAFDLCDSHASSRQRRRSSFLRSRAHVCLCTGCNGSGRVGLPLVVQLSNQHWLESSKHPARSHCSSLGKASASSRRSSLVSLVVRTERPTPELGHARLNTRTEERAAGPRLDRRSALSLHRKREEAGEPPYEVGAMRLCLTRVAWRA